MTISSLEWENMVRPGDVRGYPDLAPVSGAGRAGPCTGGAALQIPLNSPILTKESELMRKASLGIALALLTAVPAVASAQADVMTVVHQFVDGFNKGDTKSAAAACADEASIIDEFPPYEWHGAGACMAWMADYDTDAKKNGITDGLVTLGTPRHVDVNGDRAYIVIPSNYTYKHQGNPVEEIGSTLTVALYKEAAGWRITAWAWSKN
jgi:ketosteroid isomerase-like protein